MEPVVDIHARDLYDAISRDLSSFDQIITPLTSMDLKMDVIVIAITENAAGIVQSFLDAGMIGRIPQDILGTAECDLDSELGYAVRWSADAVVKVLLAARANPNTLVFHETDMCSAISYAIRRKNITIVKQLLDSKCDISSCQTGLYCSSGTPKHWPSICFAAKYGNTEIVSLLLEERVDVNAPHLYGNTALHFAVKHDQRRRDASAMIRTLAAAGAHVDSYNDRGYSPLYVACVLGHDNYIRVLVEAGANPFRLAREPLMREPILSLRPEAAHLHVYPGIEDAALALVLCRTAVDEAHPFCDFPPEMLIQLLHELSCIFVLGY